MIFEYSYLLTPFFTWLLTGITKFSINCFRSNRLAFDQIGYGGMPSNHSAIVSSIATLIWLREGLESPAFGVAITLAFIVILDAGSLRQHIGKHARQINVLSHANLNPMILRERIGHSKAEIFFGIALGFVSSLFIYFTSTNCD